MKLLVCVSRALEVANALVRARSSSLTRAKAGRCLECHRRQKYFRIDRLSFTLPSFDGRAFSPALDLYISQKSIDPKSDGPRQMFCIQVPAGCNVYLSRRIRVSGTTSQAEQKHCFVPGHDFIRTAKSLFCVGHGNSVLYQG